jgi:dihydroorotate dehydrogenase
MYSSVIRPLLFRFDAEQVHHFTFKLLKIAGLLPGAKALLAAVFRYQNPALVRTVAGLRFENPVGLAAGFDKNAMLIDELASLGFGFIEIGTITPKPQPGNELPRLFRLPADQAIINRMGFNNEGVEAAVQRLRNRQSSVLVGGNIGKNKVTPNENAFEDYAICFEALFPWVDYFVVNVSSPNTPGLRALQEKEPLQDLLLRVRTLNQQKPIPKPVFLKIAPDLTQEQLDDVVSILQATGTDGVIATNTTVSRAGLQTDAATISKIGAGGLSGRPLADRSNEVIRYLRNKLGPDFPIIGVGGIMTAEDALEKLKSGADLIQIYTGFVYEGPGFVKKILKRLALEK